MGQPNPATRCVCTPFLCELLVGLVYSRAERVKRHASSSSTRTVSGSAHTGARPRAHTRARSHAYADAHTRVHGSPPSVGGGRHRRRHRRRGSPIEAPYEKTNNDTLDAGDANALIDSREPGLAYRNTGEPSCGGERSSSRLHFLVDGGIGERGLPCRGRLPFPLHPGIWSQHGTSRECDKSNARVAAQCDPETIRAVRLFRSC